MTTKTYLTTEQFIKVLESLSDEKLKELDRTWWDGACDKAWEATWSKVNNEAWWDGAWWDGAWHKARDEAWGGAWLAAQEADCAIRAKDLIPTEHFTILADPWTSCGLSLYADDWADVLGGDDNGN